MQHITPKEQKRLDKIADKAIEKLIAHQMKTAGKPTYEKDKKCLCGKPLPIVPHCCPKCKRMSFGKKKVVIVNLGHKQLPSGKIIV